MKKNIFLIVCLAIINFSFAQDQIETQKDGASVSDSESANDSMLTGNFVFDVTDTGNNSKQHEYGSGFFKQKYIVISAKKIGGLGGAKDPLTGEPHTQIYCATVKKTGDLDNLGLFSRILNTPENEGSITFSPDQRTIYYTRDDIPDDKKIYQIFRARDAKGFGQWQGEEKLSFNNPEYSIENPYLTKDGKTLYFTSNQPGGLGGYDIYKVNVNNDGTFGKPVNLGDEVNTPQDEITPFIDDNNKYLYFASSGRNTLGGLDIFRSRKVGHKFVRPLNMGPSINDEGDDYAFILANEKRGYVTSNKKDGVGGSDVYKFRLEYNRQLIKGIVKDEETQEIIPDAILQITDMDGNAVALKAGKDGTFSAYVDPYEIYTIQATREGYDDNAYALDTNSATQRIFNTEVNMRSTPAEIVEVDGKTMIKIENIYFDFNKSTIRKASKVSLEKIVTVLNDNPKMKIEVNAHTDIRGSAPYNLALSKRRAASTMKHLIHLGIDANRLISKGYGESQPLIDCESKECSDEEHEINRRIEFVIIPE